MKLKIVVDGPPVIRKSDANKMLKREFRNRGKAWHRLYRLPHFSTIAYARYQYSKRSEKYNTQKRRRFGHADPLVFTGTSKRLSAQHRVIANSKGVRVTMGIRVFNFRSRLSKIDKRKEMQTVANFENAKLDKMNERGITNRIKRYRHRTELR